jgi:predicted nucleotidyltransferase
MDRKADIIKKIREVLSSCHGITICIVYGSAVTGKLNVMSDIDIAVAGNKVLDVNAKLSLTLALSESIGRDVDLVDLRTVSGLIVKNIITKGIRIKCMDKNYFARLIKDTWFFNEDFLPAVRNILYKRARRFAYG